MNNAVFLGVTPCAFCKNRSFGGTYRLHHQGDKNRRARNNVSILGSQVFTVVTMKDAVFLDIKT
jgi:hypothetical protein